MGTGFIFAPPVCGFLLDKGVDMRNKVLVRMLILLAVVLLITGYLTRVFAQLVGSLGGYFPAILIGLWVVGVLFLVVSLVVPVLLQRSLEATLTQKAVTVATVLFAPALLAFALLILEEFVRILRGAGAALSGRGFMIPNRFTPYDTFVFIAYAILLLLMIDGATGGRYRYGVTRVKVPIAGLPAAFDGFRIAQFSDAHTGSFTNGEKVARGIKMINDLKADVICFTGDLVNNHHEEATPFGLLYGSLRASYGVYSVLGNHDYGDYVKWRTPIEKAQNLENLKAFQKGLGWKMLNNEHAVIEKGGAQFYLAGVENWGEPPFPQHGDLQQALQGVPVGAPVVLLSHDPSHWNAKVRRLMPQIKLALAGHTHAMQFGFSIFGLKFSPVALRYKQWWGLYTDADQHLFVSRGFGYIGFRGRVGMWPEIVEITLRAV